MAIAGDDLFIRAGKRGHFARRRVPAAFDEAVEVRVVALGVVGARLPASPTGFLAGLEVVHHGFGHVHTIDGFHRLHQFVAVRGAEIAELRLQYRDMAQGVVEAFLVGAVKLADGDILRVGRTTDSVFYTMLSSSVLLGGLLILIFAVTFILVRKQTKDLIEPINTLNLEEPLKDVAYEELRPLLGRVDQQNKQIAKQMEELKEAEAVRREFSANVSHELKTPLMSISGYAELMMNGMVPDEKVPEFSGRIYHEASRLSALVADIIQLSRLDEKNSDLPFEPVDLYELAEDIVLHLDSAASKKNINVSLEGNSVTVQGVRHVIYEMLYNIADNAIRYTNQNGTVNIFTGTINGHAFYRVEDNGIGIPENEQKRIFERFYRVDKSHSRATGGTGLGLSIVKHGAILHNAEIKLKSEPGKGTKMELVF